MSASDHRWANGLFITDPLCLIFLVFMFLYFVTLEGLVGATLGKWALGLRVVTDGGDRPGLARIRMAQGQWDEASKLLERLLEIAEVGGHTTRTIEVLLLQVLTSQAAGDTAGAMAPLARGLTLAEPGGIFQIFVDEGPPLARLLNKAVARGVMPEYTARLLAAFDGTTYAQQPPSSLTEPLSERKLEELRRIAEGLTNQEIASRLYLSLHTVKSHTRNIYGKLGVHGRTQAVVRARTLGVLPST